MKKLMWIILMAVLALLFGSGCAAIPKEQRLAIAAKCGEDIACTAAMETKALEQIEYDRQERLDLHVDKFNATKEWCANARGMAMMKDWQCRGRDKLCPPKRITDRFQCVDVRSFLRQMQGFPF